MSEFKVGDLVKLVGPGWDYLIKNDLGKETWHQAEVSIGGQDSSGFFFENWDGEHLYLETGKGDPYEAVLVHSEDEEDHVYRNMDYLENLQNEHHNLLEALQEIYDLLEEGEDTVVVQAYIKGVRHAFGKEVE